ncbi:MAG: thermostable hemolysin [Rhodospirillales bacterium]|nr:thermostable hemolysin [Alphaproteobacteria bacterium]USO03064.1 MAG: thermostable hemolysin [Rhodospirillales bacterium]
MLTLQYRENNLNTANLHLKESRASKISGLNPSVVSITGMFEPERKRVEDFIKAIYKQSYDADIRVDYPILMSVRNADNDILAAVGFRYADRENLFLERYTGTPMESILNCPRREIVEIGNLASAGKGASAFLFAALASYLNNKHIRYAAITGTDFLHRYFERTGLNPRKICEADIAAVQEDGQNWGTYYDTQPRVLVGSVETGIKRLKIALGAEFEECRPRLFPRLHYKQDS